MKMLLHVRIPHKEFNAAVREVSRGTGTIVVDLARHRFAGDPRFWSDDRLHANSEGHLRIAAALAEAVGSPGANGDWSVPPPPRARPSLAARLGAELSWTRKHFIPWVVRHARGRSSGDGIVAKRPLLTPVTPATPDGFVTPRRGHVATWDEPRNRMIMWGGVDGAGTLSSTDTWALDFTVSPPAWRKLATTGTPPPGRFHAAAALEASTSTWYLFGGTTELGTRISPFEIFISCAASRSPGNIRSPVSDSKRMTPIA